MKKILLPLALMLGASSAYSSTTPACSAYIDRVEGTNPKTTYDGGGAAILTVDQAVKTAATVIFNDDTLNRILPFASIFLRALGADGGATAPDPDLVGCLIDIQNRLGALEAFDLVQPAKNQISAVESFLQSEVGVLNNQNAHIHAFNEYDSISEKLANTINTIFAPETDRTGSRYRALRDEALIILLSTEIMAYVHNLEASAYCARERDYSWSNTATNLVRYNDSGNYGLVDYRAQETASNLGYQDVNLFESTIADVGDGNGCDLGRRAYSRMQSILSENSETFPIAQVFVDLGFTITKSSSNPNYLNVSFDPDNSKLLDYRLDLIDTCNVTVGKWTVHDGLVSGRRVRYSITDYGFEEEPMRSVDLITVEPKDDAQAYYEQECADERKVWVDDATEEVVSYLNGLKTTLDNINLYEFTAPATALADRKLPYNTYKTGELNADETQDYMLVPQFDIDSSDDIVGNFNQYQIYHSTSDRYLKSRAGEGVFTRTIGSGSDSYWQVHQKWPGLSSQLKSVSTGDCLVESNGSFNTQNCDDSTYLWPSSTTTGFAAKSLMYLHASEHTGLCLGVDSGDIAAVDCDVEDSTQQFVLGDEHSSALGLYQIKSAGLCLEVPSTSSLAGQTLIAAECQTDYASQYWALTEDSTILTVLSAFAGAAYCLDAVTTEESVNISLQVCDSPSPTQRIIPKTDFALSYSNVEIEHTTNGACLAGCGTALNIEAGDTFEGTVNIYRQNDGRVLKHNDSSSPYFAPGTGAWGSWYLEDENNDGVYVLRSYETDECLSHNGSNMTAQACGSSSEVWKIDNAQ